MSPLFYLALSVLFVQFLVELIKVLRGLERHEYINGSYEHSIQHFAYLTFYFTGTTLIFCNQMSWGILFFISGTIVLNYHIRQERLNRL